MAEPTDPDLFERVEPGARKAHKRLILNVALRCFNQAGIAATPIDTIREQANSSIGSIYHHFGNKEGLVAALFFAALDDQMAQAQPRIEGAGSTQEAVHALVHTFMEWMSEQPELARFMVQARASVADGPFKDALAQRNRLRYGRMLQWLEAGVRQGSIRALPREAYASLLIGAAENYGRAWLSGRVQTPPKDIAAVFADAAWRAVGMEPPTPAVSS